MYFHIQYAVILLYMEKALITFIIPTIGRQTLERTLKCLINQTRDNWKAIVIFDGIDVNLPIIDKRISAIKINKSGEKTNIHNMAGNVRNFGIKEVGTEWIGFVDDDDAISHKYVERLEEEISLNSDAKCIIFRMLDKMKILPQINDNNFYKCKVGISFVIRKDLNETFQQSMFEDYELLNKLRNNKLKIIISPYVNYFVRSPINNFMDNKQYNRIIIN